MAASNAYCSQHMVTPLWSKEQAPAREDGRAVLYLPFTADYLMTLCRDCFLVKLHHLALCTNAQYVRAVTQPLYTQKIQRWSGHENTVTQYLTVFTYIVNCDITCTSYIHAKAIGQVFGDVSYCKNSGPSHVARHSQSMIHRSEGRPKS